MLEGLDFVVFVDVVVGRDVETLPFALLTFEALAFGILDLVCFVRSAVTSLETFDPVDASN